jgi:16S rRNA (cytidine1402-2'-O)-methyltransferase
VQVFYGFVPSKRGAARSRKLAEVGAEPKACVLYEAPHRILDTLRELIAAAATEQDKAAVEQRAVVCARELTKQHEEVHRGTVGSALAYFGQEGAGLVKGEFTLVRLLPLAATLTVSCACLYLHCVVCAHVQ